MAEMYTGGINCGYDALFLRLGGGHMRVHYKVSLYLSLSLSPHIFICMLHFKCCIRIHIFIYATLKMQHFCSTYHMADIVLSM